MTVMPQNGQPNHGRTVAKLVGVVVFMGGLAWASVPLYDWFCRVTGFGGTPLTSTDSPDVILERTVNVRFDASIERDMPWEFRPVEREMEIRIGETGLAFYEAYNPTNRPIAGSAAFNVFPYEAGVFFTKIACFCFEEQRLLPGETVEMPVFFFIDPEILDDPQVSYVRSVTLSYTFFQTDEDDDDEDDGDDGDKVESNK